MRSISTQAIAAGIAALSLTGFTPALPAQSAKSPAESVREQTADQQVQHVLHRLAFGPRPGDAERVRAMGVDAWIEEQLHPERINDSRTNEWLAQFSTLTMSGQQLIDKYPPPAQQLARMAVRERAMQTRNANGDTASLALPEISRADSTRLRQEAVAAQRALSEVLTARTGRAIATERQLQEVLVDFWANHFNVFLGKAQTRYYIAEFEHNTIRPHVLGKFRDMLGAVAKSPAMLVYLDQALSVADSGSETLARARVAPRLRAAQMLDNPRRPRGINENYARELMELHTLGVDGGYTQKDVTEVARALTGWGLRRGQGGGFFFRADAHDAGAKVILGKSFPAGKGEEEGERVLDLLAAHPSTARFIATKLARRFVSDSPPPALIDRAAAVFMRTKGDLREVMRAIVMSDEFFATEAFRAKVKTPFELVVSASRALDGQPDASPRSAQLIARLGQPIYGRATPDGYPDTADEWINTGAILSRMNFGIDVGAGRLPGARLAQWPAARELIREPVDKQVDGLVRALFGGDVSQDTRAILTNGTNPLGETPALTGFPRLVGLAIGAPEFQRR